MRGAATICLHQKLPFIKHYQTVLMYGRLTHTKLISSLFLFTCPAISAPLMGSLQLVMQGPYYPLRCSSFPLTIHFGTALKDLIMSLLPLTITALVSMPWYVSKAFQNHQKFMFQKPFKTIKSFEPWCLYHLLMCFLIWFLAISCVLVKEERAMEDGIPEFLKRSIILQTFGVKFNHPCQDVENVVIPPYISPERVRTTLENYPLNGRRDIWAFFRGKMEVHPKNISGRYYSK